MVSLSQPKPHNDGNLTRKSILEKKNLKKCLVVCNVFPQPVISGKGWEQGCCSLGNVWVVITIAKAYSWTAQLTETGNRHLQGDKKAGEQPKTSFIFYFLKESGTIASQAVSKYKAWEKCHPILNAGVGTASSYMGIRSSQHSSAT